jgi:hypothetical protein
LDLIRRLLSLEIRAAVSLLRLNIIAGFLNRSRIRIPIGAQIVAVADALDAMTSDRPYRAALPLHQAMTELRLGRATQWSPAVVDTVERLVNVEKRELSFGGAIGLQLA